MAEENEELAQPEKAGYDSSDPKQVRDRAAEHGRRRQRLERTLALVMSQANGRELLWEFLSLCGTHRTSFDPDPHIHAFKSGEQNFGFKLEAMLVRADAKMFSKMIEENSND